MKLPPTALTLSCWLALATAPGAVEAEPTVPPPKSWDKFVILVWQYHTKAIADQALYESVNLHGFHIDGRNDALQAFAKDTGWPFYVDHAAEKGYLHLGQAANAITRKKDIVIRPNSLADPKTVEAMKSHLQVSIGAAKGSSVVGYAFDDEISTGNFCSPVESDGSPLSVAGYQKTLAASYGTIAKLNAQYGAAFADFAAVQPQSFERFRGQLKPDAIARINLSQWCDWRSYMDTQFADCLADLTRYANTLDGHTPAGFVGGQSPNAFGGYDYRKLCASVQWMEAYDIGGSNEVLRSFWDQRHAHVQTFFSSENPRMDAWFLWYYLCQGNRGVICWPSIDAKELDWFANGQVADFIKANAATFKEIQGPVSQAIIDGRFAHDPVAIYYSQPSIQLGWALDASVHGGTWPNRLSSTDNAVSTSNLSRKGWLKTFEDLGIQARFIHLDHLLAGMLEKDGFKVLVLNRALCLSDAEAAAIRAFAAGGGTVIADHQCGLFDEHGKARAVGVLDDLFGVKRDLARGWLNGADLTEVNAELDGKRLSEKNWAVNAPRFAHLAVVERGLTAADGAQAQKAGDAAVVVRKGKTAYLNLSPIGHLLNRSGDDAKEWSALVAGLLKDAGVQPRVALSIDGQPAKLIEPLFWQNGARTTLCIVTNIDRSAAIDSFGSADTKLGDATVKLGIRFAAAVKGLKNERTGKAMGDGAAFTDDFVPWEANVYSYGN